MEVELLKQFKPIFERQYRTFVYKGGRSCVDGNTEISTPNGNVMIKDFQGGLIYTTDGENRSLCFACKPIKHEPDDLYEVKTNKKTIVVTKNHLFLTKNGWKKTSQLEIDQDCFFCENYACFSERQDQIQSILDAFPLMSLKGVQHYLRIVLGFLYCYLQDFRQYDERPLLGLKTYQDVLPLLADEEQHNFRALSHMDDLGISYIYDLSCHILDRPCNYDVLQDEVGKSYTKQGNYTCEKFSELLSEICRQFQIFRLKKDLSLLVQGLAKQVLCFYNGLKSESEIHQIVSDILLCDVDDSSYSNSFRGCMLYPHYIEKETVLQVKFLKHDFFYDMFVPFYNCYFGNGIINHNSGKSWGIADTLLLLGRITRERILCTREIQKSIETSSYQLLVDRINHHGYSDYEITKTSIKNKATGTEFIFAGLSDITGTADSLKSIENISVCWCEEAQTISDKSFKKLTPSIRGKNGLGQGSIIIISYNPETVNDPVHKRFVEIPNDKTHICHINYTDNPYCPQEIIDEAEEMKKNKPDEYKNTWLGIPDDFSNRAVVRYFSNDNIQELVYCPDEPLILTMDFNVDPMMWCVCHKDEDSLYCIDEIVVENTTTLDCAGEFISRYPNHKGDIILCGDASGNFRKTQSNLNDYMIVKNALHRYGYEKVYQHTRPFNPPIKKRIRAFNNLVYDDKGKRRFFIDPRCEKTIYNMRALLYKEGTSIIDIPTINQMANNPEMKFLGHIFDAISYPVEYYWPISLEDYSKTEVVDPDKRWTMENILKKHREEEKENKW